MVKRKTPANHVVDGFRLPPVISADVFRSALGYKPRPDDLFIATYPKCGTTWTQNIVSCIYREGKPFETVAEFMSQTPFLEYNGAGAAEAIKRPGSIKVHLPFHLTPWSKEAKYIFVARNPKDCCVSFYHHIRNRPSFEFEDGEFDDFFELFIEGDVVFGDYFDTLMSWYEHRNDSNVLFITFEELKKNTEGSILMIAEFMGSYYKELLEKNESILRNVMLYTSFEYMKDHFGSQFNVLLHKRLNKLTIATGTSKKPVNVQPEKQNAANIDDNFNFIRKGTTGDWKNYFSPTQNARMNLKFRDRTRGTDLSDVWKDEM